MRFFTKRRVEDTTFVGKPAFEWVKCFFRMVDPPGLEPRTKGL